MTHMHIHTHTHFALLHWQHLQGFLFTFGITRMFNALPCHLHVWQHAHAYILNHRKPAHRHIHACMQLARVLSIGISLCVTLQVCVKRINEIFMHVAVCVCVYLCSVWLILNSYKWFYAVTNVSRQQSWYKCHFVLASAAARQTRQATIFTLFSIFYFKFLFFFLISSHWIFFFWIFFLYLLLHFSTLCHSLRFLYYKALCVVRY